MYTIVSRSEQMDTFPIILLLDQPPNGIMFVSAGQISCAGCRYPRSIRGTGRNPREASLKLGVLALQSTAY